MCLRYMYAAYRNIYDKEGGERGGRGGTQARLAHLPRCMQATTCITQRAFLRVCALCEISKESGRARESKRERKGSKTIYRFKVLRIRNLILFLFFFAQGVRRKQQNTLVCAATSPLPSPPPALPLPLLRFESTNTS